VNVGYEWRWQSEATELIDLMNSGSELPSSVYAVTAIARPQRFFDSLTTNGFELSGTKSFPDHHRFSQQEVNAMLHYPNVAVTGKDAVKLAPIWPKGRPLWLLKLQGSGQPGLIEAIVKKLKIR